VRIAFYKKSILWSVRHLAYHYADGITQWSK